MQITVLDCPKSKFGRWHLVYDLDRWPQGSRRNRGWENAHVVYRRDATPEEVAEQAACYRYLCWRYRDWETLVEDEAEHGFNADHLRDHYYQDVLRRITRFWEEQPVIEKMHEAGLPYSQAEALLRYALRHGRCWKSRLLSDWTSGRDENQPGGGLLRQIRNSLGPVWLRKFRMPDLTNLKTLKT